jgi:serine/threonine-protein kinase RsbW
VKIDLTFSSDIVYLDAVKTIFDNFLTLTSIEGEDVGYWTWVAANEALVNAIKHGNKEDKSLFVKFCVEYKGNFLTVKISDMGKGFDMGNVADPTSPENLLKPSGRGLLFMQNIMDFVEFEQKDSWFTIVMKKEVKSV